MAWGNLLEEIGRTSWIARAAQNALESLAASDDEQLAGWLRGSAADGWEASAGVAGDWQASVGGRAEAAARAGREAAEAERRAEVIGQISTELDKALVKVASPAEKIKAVNDELATTKKRLDALRTTDTTKDVDVQIRRAEDLAARKIKEIQDDEKQKAEAAAAKVAAAQRQVD